LIAEEDSTSPEDYSQWTVSVMNFLVLLQRLQLINPQISNKKDKGNANLNMVWHDRLDVLLKLSGTREHFITLSSSPAWETSISGI
jgi:hypothetical protein